MKTIKTFTSLLGGYAYRVTSNGVIVNYCERHTHAARWQVVASESMEHLNNLLQQTDFLIHAVEITQRQWPTGLMD